MRKLLLSLLLLTSISANAATTSLISVRSEDEPGETAYLGVNTDSSNHLIKVFFQKSDKTITSFSLAQLAKPQVLLERKGYRLVFLSSPNFCSTSVQLTLGYAKNVFTGDYQSRHLTIKYNSHISQYEIFDENQRPFTQAYVTTHRNALTMAVGIDEIQTQ